MPFYFRKSVKAGPFRFNFSKGGVGMSVGIRGLRIGTGPRGHYISAGRGGIHYRASLGNVGRPTVDRENVRHFDPSQLVFDVDTVEMVDIESGEVQAMGAEGFNELLDEINKKQGQVKLANVLGWSIACIGFTLLLAIGPPAMMLMLMAVPGVLVGRWLDSYRRRTVLYYDLDSENARRYADLATAFDALCNSAGRWHIESGGAVQDLATWKRNAGATHLVNKKPTVLTYKLPKVIASNVTPPAIHVGRQIMYFLPDVILVEDGTTIGAIGYPQISVRCDQSNFIEEGGVPPDAKVIGNTWKHPNKTGGPDRRFKNNYLIPICQYEVMHLSSPTGLNELLEFSRLGVSPPFGFALKAMPRYIPDAQNRHFPI